MARKTIVEATSKIMGQKEINLTLPDDRGPLDLTRRIDELEAEVLALKKKQEEPVSYTHLTLPTKRIV